MIPSLDVLRRRSSYKWRLHPDDVLPAFVAESDFELAPAVRHAIETAAQLGDAGYAWPSPELGTSFAEFALQRYGWRVAPDDVTVVPDVMVGVVEVLRRIAGPGDGVVINPPVYHPFFAHIVEAGCRVVEAPLARDAEGYTLDLDALEAAFADARVYLLCNPHNPTGASFGRALLEQIVDLAERHGVTILADEIHAPLVMSGAAHVPLLSLGDAATARALAFHSASKAWNIPGLKCAQVIAASGPMRAAVATLPEALTFRSGHLGMLASVAAYRDGAAWLDSALRLIEGAHQLFATLIAAVDPRLSHRRPDATYLAWLDCRALELGDDPAATFLERGRVALDSGPRFGREGAGFVRVTLGTSDGVIREITRRMAVALGG